MKKANKWIFRILLGLLLIVILGLAAAPYILYRHQKEITQLIIKELNESFKGEIEIDDSYLSPFKNFPYISIDLHGIRFYESKLKNARPLYEIHDLYLGFDILSLIRGNLDVKSIKISGGQVNLVQLEDGTINLLMAKGLGEMAEEIEDEGESEGFHFDLKELIIKDFEIAKYNESNGQFIFLHLEELKSGFKKAPKHLYSTIDAFFVLDITEHGDTSFFKNKHMEIHATVDYDEVTEILLIDKAQAILENAAFKLNGKVDFKDDLNLDLNIRGDKPNFSIFTAFAPEEIDRNLRRYENQGQIYFEASIKGKSINGHNPLIEAKFGCENAYFLEKNEKRRVDDLAFEGTFTNGEQRNLETMEFRLLNFNARPEQGIFRGSFVIRNFVDPYIAMNVYSELDLEFLGQFFGLEGLRQLRGQVILNMDFDELVDINVPENSIAQLKEGIDSDLTFKNLSFKVPGYPHKIENANLHAQMREGAVEIDTFSFQIAGSDFNFNGYVSDLPAIFHRSHKDIDFRFSASSKQINVPQLLSFDSALAKISDEVIQNFAIDLAFNTSVDQLYHADPLPQGTFYIKNFYAKLKNYPHIFHDFHADIIINEKDFSLVDFSGEIDQSDFHFDGKLSNYKVWFDEVKKGKSTFDFNLRSKLIQPSDLLSYEGENYLPEEYRDEQINNLHLHGLVHLDYDSIFKSADLIIDQFQAKMKLHPMKMERFKGRLHFEDEHLLVENFSGVMGNSDFLVNMAYYTGEDRTIKKRDNFFSLSANRLDLDQLMNYSEEEAIKSADEHEEDFNVFEIPFTDMSLNFQIGKVNWHKIILQDMKARMRMQENHYFYIDTLHLLAAGGSMGLKGYLNGSDPETIYFKSDLDARKIDLGQFLFKFDNFGQDVLINDNLQGQFNGLISSHMRLHSDLTPILADGEAHLEVEILDGSINNFGPMQAMSGFFKDKNLSKIRFDTLKNTLDLKAGVLSIPSMTINSSLGYIELSGRQSLDLDMDYYVRVPLKLVTQAGFSALFGGKKKEEIDPEQEDDIIRRDPNRKTRFVNVRIKGNPDKFDISLQKDKNKAI